MKVKSKISKFEKRKLVKKKRLEFIRFKKEMQKTLVKESIAILNEKIN